MSGDLDRRQDMTDEVERLQRRPRWHSVVLDLAFIVGVVLAALVLRACG